MKNKLFIFSVLIFSAFIFSACGPKNQAELELLNRNGNQIDQNINGSNQETGDDTEDELLDQIDTYQDPNLDADFKNLDTELNN